MKNAELKYLVNGTVLTNLASGLAILATVFAEDQVKVSTYKSQVRITVDGTIATNGLSDEQKNVLTELGFTLDENKDYIMIDLANDGEPTEYVKLVVKEVKPKVEKVKTPKVEKEVKPAVETVEEVVETDEPTAEDIAEVEDMLANEVEDEQ